MSNLAILAADENQSHRPHEPASGFKAPTSYSGDISEKNGAGDRQLYRQLRPECACGGTF